MENLSDMTQISNFAHNRAFPTIYSTRQYMTLSHIVLTRSHRLVLWNIAKSGLSDPPSS